MGYVAVLDANVLHPWILCDILLRLAERGLFRPVWSSEILDEVVRSIARRRPDLSADRVRHRVDRMNAAFPDAMISDYEPVRSAVPTAVHAGDIHVVATAISARADVIVTADVNDMPTADVGRLGILVQGPDEFLVHQWGLDPNGAAAAIVEMAQDTRRPPLTPAQVLESLARVAPDFAGLVGQSGSPTIADPR